MKTVAQKKVIQNEGLGDIYESSLTRASQRWPQLQDAF
jgi:hypothetical protein